MKARACRAIGVLLVCAGVWACERTDTAGSASPNLLLVSVDTLRADHVGAYGYPKPTTPFLDELAARGHRFARAYASATTTLPSHAAMLTGFHPGQMQVTQNGMIVDAGVTTLAERLKAAGYATGAFVSAHVLASRTGFDQGFDVYEEPADPLRNGARTVDLAERWIEARDGGPFFAFVHLYEPHAPYHAPEQVRALFDAPDGAVPEHLEFLPEAHAFAAGEIEATIRAYDADVRYADDLVRRLVGSLGAKLDDTILVVVSDHGESLDDLIVRHRYAFDHGEFLYAHQLHVPWIWVLPDGSRGVHEQPVCTVDLTPTLLDLLALPPDRGLFGTSLAGLFAGTAASGSPAYAQRRTFDGEHRPSLRGQAFSLISDDWHLIFGDVAGAELYDLASDPAEQRDVVAAHAAVAGTLGARVADFRKVIAAPVAVSRPDRDAASREKLRALGYVD